jgi:hypothetical protein
MENGKFNVSKGDRYLVLFGDSINPIELEDSVNSLLGDGFRCQGGISSGFAFEKQTDGSYFKYETIHQAMIKPSNIEYALEVKAFVELSHTITNMLLDGWVCQGGVSSVGEGFFAQAMIKETF